KSTTSACTSSLADSWSLTQATICGLSACGREVPGRMAMLSIFVLMSVVGIDRVGSAVRASIAVLRASERRTWLNGQSFLTGAVTPITTRPSGAVGAEGPGQSAERLAVAIRAKHRGAAGPQRRGTTRGNRRTTATVV